MAQVRKGLLARLGDGVVIGDGGFCFALEKLGYVKVGVYTPECTVLYPNAVRELHRAFLRSGSDVMQSFNFLSSESKLSATAARVNKPLPSGKDINLAAYNIAREVANEGDALVCVSLNEPTSALKGEGKDVVQAELRQQIKLFVDEKCDIDFVACEYYSRIATLEWAIEVCKEFGLTVAATMCIGPTRDEHGVPVGECAVRMAKAGAEVVGVNCNFGPPTCLETIKMMKDALDKEHLKPYLMTQPLGLLTPEVNSKGGYCDLPGHFIAYEPRVCTRFEMQDYARKAYELGVRYIGGCCGTEPYHIRAIAEELSAERKIVPPVTQEFGDILSGIRDNPWKRISSRSDKEYWRNFKPSTGRPESSAYAPVIYTD